MKIKITMEEIVEIDPRDYREVNEDGKYGPFPGFEEIKKIIEGDDPNYLFCDPKITVEEIG